MKLSEFLKWLYQRLKKYEGDKRKTGTEKCFADEEIDLLPARPIKDPSAKIAWVLRNTLVTLPIKLNTSLSVRQIVLDFIFLSLL